MIFPLNVTWSLSESYRKPGFQQLVIKDVTVKEFTLQKIKWDKACPGNADSYLIETQWTCRNNQHSKISHLWKQSERLTRHRVSFSHQREKFHVYGPLFTNFTPKWVEIRDCFLQKVFLTVFLIDFLEMFEVRVSTIEIRADVYRLSENLALLRHLLI